jgi:hypothetical protein
VKTEVRRLTLDFPHGVSIKIAEKIARDASMIVQAGVSEGGFEVVGITPDGEGLIFSDDCMQYVYGHKREKKSAQSEGEG